MRYSVVLLAFLIGTTFTADAQSFSVGDSIIVTEETHASPKPGWVPTPDRIGPISGGSRFKVMEVSEDGRHAKIDLGGKYGWLHTVAFMTPEQAAEKRRREAEERREAADKARADSARLAREKAEVREYTEFLQREGYGLILEGMRHSINSAGGVTVRIDLRPAFPQGRTIKYIYFTLVPYNRVGDQVYGTNSGESKHVATAIGPIAPDAGSTTIEFENIWYNKVTYCIELLKMRVEYMDGSSHTYINDLKDIIRISRGVTLAGECQL